MNLIIAFVFVTMTGMIGPVENGLKFDHKAHVTERAMECAGCHKVASSETASDRNIPDHEICADCHSIDEDPQDCGYCHVNPADPAGVILGENDLVFSHKGHLDGNIKNTQCLVCHAGMDQVTAGQSSGHPVMDDCFACHNGSGAPANCSTCHTKVDQMTLLVHEPNWKHEHKFATDLGGQNCVPCHEPQAFCAGCHAGDNLVETVHELNYLDSHGIDARGDEIQCQTCHDRETFCASCHAGNGHEPLDHMSFGWAHPPYDHAQAAQQDVEACAACHSTESPICANCHFDTDGIIGTNPPIHPASMDYLGEGPWHDDSGFQCFTCHVDTRQAGTGFCGYCHGNID